MYINDKIADYEYNYDEDYICSLDSPYISSPNSNKVSYYTS